MRQRKTAWKTAWQATWKTDTALCLLGVLCAVLSVQFAISKISDTAAPGVAGMEHLRIFAMPSGGRLPAKAGGQVPMNNEPAFDPIVTGSIRPITGEPMASTSSRAGPARSPERSSPQAAPLNTVTVQGVFDGKALLQGPFGYLLVSSGDTIPGIGRVQSIQSRGGNWIVQTPLGNLESGK